ncbi:MAG: aminotransferase class I/II-fold pyridoxal phosphate-dependent enzyme [Clostridia bacterium]|nr:aminotransferase class I/II-fold pyridoxal phosphate-dependent enzyme [Clostridia bacterium]
MLRNDYSEIAAPQVLEALQKCAGEQNVGYGLDVHSKKAEKLILERFGLFENEAKAHFLAGGTQTNATVISYFLRPYEAVIACASGHINVHETGAVEGTGHKVYTCPSADGKLLPEDIEKAVLLHADEHMVSPKMVYISNSTETGTIYTKAELLSLRGVCDKYGLLLFMDGARLGVALTCEKNDVTCEFIGEICDVFYVGGTKNGALMGEAVVIKNKIDAGSFRHHIKNRGAMLAKGFAVGIQFKRLFEDGLYFELAKNSNRTADIIRAGLNDAKIQTIGNSPTNQIFINVKRDLADALIEKFGLELWEDCGHSKTVRIVTSFATADEECEKLIGFIKSR